MPNNLSVFHIDYEKENSSQPISNKGRNDRVDAFHYLCHENKRQRKEHAEGDDLFVFKHIDSIAPF